MNRRVLLLSCLLAVAIAGIGCKACRPTPSAPVPLAPPNGSRVATLVPTLKVQDMGAKGVDQYRWTIKDPAGTVTGQGVSVQPSWTVSKGLLANETEYSWTCAAHNSRGWGKESPVWKFTTDLRAPGAPEPVSPANGSEVTTTNPRLEVNPIPEVDEYTWTVKDSTGAVAAQGTSEGASWIVAPSLTDKQKYTWSATARNPAGTGPASAEWTFRVKVPPPPKLAPPPSALRTIHFDFDKYDIRPGDAVILEGNAGWLKQNLGVNVTLEGYCDPIGTEEYNRGLGLRRANSAKRYLEKLGIDASRLGVISFGEDKLVTTDSAQYELNRRVEFVQR